MTYDPDRFDAEIILDRTGHTTFTCEVVAEVLGITQGALRKRVSRGVYARPAIHDGAVRGYVDAINKEQSKHQWSREQMIDMMLMGKVKRKSPPRKPIEHGTIQGYWAHERRKVPYCDPCREAHNEYERAGRRQRVAA